jgi:two-component system CheB/CheR fusion protein
MSKASDEENVLPIEEREQGPDSGVLEQQDGDETDIGPERGQSFPVVGIGGSAGALDAFTKLLQALPDDTNMAFVFVQHLDPHHVSQLPEILTKNTSMPVRNVEDGMSIQPNEVYVIPPNTTMVLENGVLRLAHRNPGLHLPIDAFFQSLARVQGSRAIGVVLSGNASDGSQGVKAIKQECGLTFAQDESSAQHLGMPRNATATGAVDYVLSPAEIARELVRLSHHPFVRHSTEESPDGEVLPEGDGELAKIFRVLRQRTMVDFTHYKRKTIRRRIGRRMIVNRHKTLGEYAQMLEQQPQEVTELYRDLLISVTNFFRDPEVFAALSVLLKNILLSRNPNEMFRVWVAGCATGEEVYSLAICLRELMEELEINTAVQFFGTDISDLSLDRARAATYPEFITADVSQERLRRFFVRVDRGYQVNKTIRETCVFARQDVTHDPPFGNMDLIGCRNLLIYLDSVLQRKVLPVFHYSLKPSGLLLLGAAESIATASDLFNVVDKEHRIYGRKAAPVRLTLNLSKELAPSEPESKVHTTMSGIDLLKKADLVIQSKYAPSAVVIDADFRILQFRGRTGFYLEPIAGEASFDLLRMTREGLIRPLRKALEAAANQAISVREDGITVEYMGERREIAIEITPISGASEGERYFMVAFLELSAPANSTAATSQTPSVQVTDETLSLEAQNRGLQKQVAELREQLRNANEDHEAHTEELRASNEEVRSANEELQSTNEELSTTKEELQSANEELTTLNEELQTRNNELNIANSDLGNLLSAADFAFLIVDNELRLRRFSTAAEKFLNVNATDVGHTLRHFQGHLEFADLEPLLHKVVQTLSIQQRDIQDKSGRWLSATIRPYRTIDNRIAGAVIVLADIDELKRNLRVAEAARDYAEGLIDTVREPLVVLDSDLRVERATSAFYDAFRVSRAETEGRFLYDLGNGQWNIPRLREALGECLFRNHSFQDIEIEHTFPYIGRRRMRLNAKRISRDGEPRRSVLLAIEDVTVRQQQAEVRYQRLFETAKDGMLVFDAETLKLTDVNPFFLALTGFSREDLIGCRLPDMDVFAFAEQAKDIVKEARSKEIVRLDGIGLRTIEGQKIQADLIANLYSVGGQQVVHVNIRDVTTRNRTFEELRRSEERFRLLVDSVRDYALFQVDLNGRISSWNSGAERLLGYTESEILGQPIARIFTPEDNADRQSEKELTIARTTGSSEDERWHVRKDGSRFFASGVLTTVKDEAGRLRGFAKVMRDITAKNQAEEQLREQAQLLDLAQDLIMTRQLDGTILFWNHSAAEHFGWTGAEAKGQNSYQLLTTKFSRPLAEIEATLFAEGRWEGELVHTRRNGSPMVVWSRWALQYDAEAKPVSVLEIGSDISARKRADEQLRASLQEKEVLLKEIHHRVKNNLQIISSLLNLQTEYVADKEAQVVLEEMNTRVRSIAAIHELLYAAKDLSRIEFALYLKTLAKDVTSFYSNRRGDAIRVDIDSEPVWLEITQAVPCGLLVNELLTNGLKHAFPDARPGQLRVSFRCSEDQCVLDVADNGVGLPETISLQNASSMGFQLLNLLVQQLKGTLHIDRSSGTRFTIVFMRKAVASEQAS